MRLRRWGELRLTSRSVALPLFVAALPLLVLGCNSSDTTDAVVTTTTSPTAVREPVDSVSSQSVWCERATQLLTAEPMREPNVLLEELDQTSRDGLGPDAQDRVDEALLASREALHSAMDPDGSYDWSASTIVEATNATCGTSIDSFEVARRTQT